MRHYLIVATCLALGATAAFAQVSVRFSGSSTASPELQADTLQTLLLFGEALDCSAPTSVVTHILPERSIPMRAEYRVDVAGTTYEQWDAQFCGRTERFLIVYSPDPAGGTGIRVNYPYPLDAPIRR